MKHNKNSKNEQTQKKKTKQHHNRARTAAHWWYDTHHTAVCFYCCWPYTRTCIHDLFRLVRTTLLPISSAVYTHTHTTCFVFWF